MSFLLAASLAAAIQPTCSWDNPGRNPYTGSTAAAIDRYTDIPEAVRSTLKRRIEERQSDDTVEITRNGINGKSQYNPAIRDMYFGNASMCTSVTRSKWAESRKEPAAVYCVGEHCILVPRICGNISRISKQAPAVAAAPPAATQTGDEKPTEFADVALVDAEPPPPPDDLEDAPKRTPHLIGMSGGPAGPGIEEFVVDDDVGLYIPPTIIIPDDDGHIPSAVPEADTWAMLLGGLGVLGWVARRRARAAKAAPAAE